MKVYWLEQHSHRVNLSSITTHEISWVGCSPLVSDFSTFKIFYLIAWRVFPAVPRSTFFHFGSPGPRYPALSYNKSGCTQNYHLSSRNQTNDQWIYSLFLYQLSYQEMLLALPSSARGTVSYRALSFLSQAAIFLPCLAKYWKPSCHVLSSRSFFFFSNRSFHIWLLYQSFSRVSFSVLASISWASSQLGSIDGSDKLI